MPSAFSCPISRDLTRSSDDRATSAVEAIAARALVRTEDAKLLGDAAAVVGAYPAGLLASAPELSSGSPGGIETDLEAMFSFVTDGKPTRPVLVTSPRAALWMALQVTENGSRFPGARVDGTGHVGGIPMLTSHAAANRVILIDVGELVVVDDGVEASASQQAAVEMDDSPTTGAAQLVSGFQTNTSFLRFIRRVWWALLRDDAIAYTTIAELAGSPA